MIPSTRAYSGGSVQADPIVTAVVLTYHTYAAGSSGGDIVEVGGVSYVHTTGTVRVDNPNVTASDKKNEKKVDGCCLIHSGNAAAAAQRVYDYWQKRNTVNVKVVTDGEGLMGYVTVPTAWGSTMTGSIVSMKYKLSNLTAADVEVLCE